MVPGEVVAAGGEVEVNPGRERRTLVVENTGDRPVQVGSHFHFADVNAALAFDREAATGAGWWCSGNVSAVDATAFAGLLTV